MKSNTKNMVQGFYLKPCSSSRSSTLAETIASMEELLTEILVRVPARPLLRFKCVSKRWLSLISNPKFCHRHTLQNPHSPISAVFSDSPENFSFIPVPPPDHDPSGNQNHNSTRWNPLKVLENQYGCVKIMSSCNGLLCCPVYSTKTSRSPYFILNPTTNQFLTLEVPPCPAISDGQLVEGTHILGLSLAFDPSKPPHYKVIYITRLSASTPLVDQTKCRHYQIQIYSSETRSWRLPNSSFNINFLIGYHRPVYWNRTIHWVGVYCDMSYYHIDEERVNFVNSSPHCYEKKWHEREYIYFKQSSGGHLHLIDIYKPCLTKFEVLEMGRDYFGWFVKYNVDLDPLCTSFPHIGYGCFFVLLLRRDEDEEEDSSSLLLHTPGQVISCNLKSKTFKSFECKIITYHNFLVEDENYLYKETLACV